MVDLLFVSSALGGALLVAVTAALDSAEQAAGPGDPAASTGAAGEPAGEAATAAEGGGDEGAG